MNLYISLKWLSEHIEVVSYEGMWHETETDEFVSVKDIHSAPSIDIVLCQDCKHYEDPDHKIFENCVKWKEPHGIILPMKPNDSCSYGERVDKYEKEYRELGLGKLKALRQTERESE